MGFRFRKIVRIAPGVRINLSKTGVSTSVGKPGATVNIGRGRSRVSIGAPGTGMGYSKDFKYGQLKSGRVLLTIILLLLLGVAIPAAMHYLGISS